MEKIYAGEYKGEITRTIEEKEYLGIKPDVNTAFGIAEIINQKFTTSEIPPVLNEIVRLTLGEEYKVANYEQMIEKIEDSGNHIVNIDSSVDFGISFNRIIEDAPNWMFMSAFEIMAKNDKSMMFDMVTEHLLDDKADIHKMLYENETFTTKLIEVLEENEIFNYLNDDACDVVEKK